MRSITVNLYQFDELPDKAKNKALQELYTVAEYPCHDENHQTLKAIEKAFKLERFEWGYDTCTSYYSFTLPHCFKQGLNRKKLLLTFKYLKKDNPFVSGYWLLESFECDFWECFNSQGDIKAALDHAIGEVVKWCHKDMEDYFSEENLAKYAMANEFEFTEDGSMWWMPWQ